PVERQPSRWLRSARRARLEASDAREVGAASSGEHRQGFRYAACGELLNQRSGACGALLNPRSGGASGELLNWGAERATVERSGGADSVSRRWQWVWQERIAARRYAGHA